MSVSDVTSPEADVLSAEQADLVGAAVSPGDSGASPEVEESLVIDDLLIEDVSIDGMCGVY